MQEIKSSLSNMWVADGGYTCELLSKIRFVLRRDGQEEFLIPQVQVQVCHSKEGAKVYWMDALVFNEETGEEIPDYFPKASEKERVSGIVKAYQDSTFFNSLCQIGVAVKEGDSLEEVLSKLKVFLDQRKIWEMIVMVFEPFGVSGDELFMVVNSAQKPLDN